MRLVIALVALLVVGCGAKKVPAPAPTIVREVVTVEVDRPVLERRVPPPELMARITAMLPRFVAPSDPNATVALTPEGVRDILAFLEFVFGKDAAWKAWAAAP